MSYTLKAKDKTTSSIDIDIFTWPVMLQETGMGYVLRYGAAKDPGQYVYAQGNNGSPVSNDGYKVSPFEAKAMAAIARGYIHVNEFINKQWEDLSEEKRSHQQAANVEGRSIYIKGSGVEFLNKLKKFADFAEKSKGFTIN